MSWFTAIPIVGDILKGVLDIVDEAVEDKDQANKLKADLSLAFQNADLEKFKSRIESQTKVIVAEAQGQSWLQRNWRPILMLSIVAIVVNNYILFPYLSLFTDKVVVLDLPDKLFQLMTVGVGGYVVGRTIEKGVQTWKEKS